MEEAVRKSVQKTSKEEREGGEKEKETIATRREDTIKN